MCAPVLSLIGLNHPSPKLCEFFAISRERGRSLALEAFDALMRAETAYNLITQPLPTYLVAAFCPLEHSFRIQDRALNEAFTRHIPAQQLRVRQHTFT